MLDRKQVALYILEKSFGGSICAWGMHGKIFLMLSQTGGKINENIIVKYGQCEGIVVHERSHRCCKGRIFGI